MFSWLKQFGQKEEQRSNTHPNDKVEDGFLVVGQTRSEKSTVITSEFQFDQDTPPDYMEASGNTDLPNYTEVSTQRPGNSQYSTNTAQGYGHYQSDHSPMDWSFTNNTLQDVPFRINPKIQFMWGAGKVPVQQCFDPSKYEYDFSLEYSVVQSNLS